MEGLLRRISKVRPQFRVKGSWFILNGSASAHSATILRHFLENFERGDQAPNLFP